MRCRSLASPPGSERPDAERRRGGHRDDARRCAGLEQHRRRVSGRDDLDRAPASTVAAQTVANASSLVRSASSSSSSATEQLRQRGAAQREGPEPGAQARAERRRLGAVAGDVADEHREPVAADRDAVVEVAAEPQPRVPGR